MGHRRSEQREDAVPGQVLDRAAERLDHVHDPGHRLAHDELDLLRVEAFAERGRADEVGEERRDHLALLAQLTLRGRGGVVVRPGRHRGLL